jgi:hypothetical protein
MNKGKKFIKPKCSGKKGYCTKTSQYSEGSSNFCIGCISSNGRKHASHKKMEHNILSDITRGLSKKYAGLTMEYDVVYHDKKRPDLVISREDNNENIVMVEVDEKQHFSNKNQAEDNVRFKNYYDRVNGKGLSLSVVRIVPGENKANSMFKTERNNKGNKILKRTNGIIEKNSEHYNKYIKESVKKIGQILDNRTSYMYRDKQISLGPNVKRNSISPIFSDTSSPDISPSIPRARVILKNSDEEVDDLLFKLSEMKLANTELPMLPEKSITVSRRKSSIENEYLAAYTASLLNLNIADDIPNHSISPRKRHVTNSKNFWKRSSTPPKSTSAPPKRSSTPPKRSSAPPKRSSTPPKSTSAPPKRPSTPPKKTSFFSFLGF